MRASPEFGMKEHNKLVRSKPSFFRRKIKNSLLSFFSFSKISYEQILINREN